jgi:hypothetical protein
LLLLAWLTAVPLASPRLDPNWSRLPAGTEIPELRTATSHTFSNGDGTFTADITPAGGGESADSCQPTSTGWIEYFDYHVISYDRHQPELHYRAGNYCGAAFAKFDVSSIPDNGRVLGAQLRCFQYEAIETPLRTCCTYAGLNPDSASDTALFEAVRLGTTLADTRCDITGWVTYELAGIGVTLLQGCLGKDYVTLGINPVTGGGSSFGFYGDYRHVSLHIVYAGSSEPEIQAVRAELRTYPEIPGTSDTALLTLTNRGPHASNQAWAYSSSPRNARDSTLVGTIEAGETTSVALPLPTSENADTFVTYRLWAACPYDPWPANDTTLLTCWTFPANTYAAAGFDKSVFPPPGWIYVNNDHGGERWQRRVDRGMSHSGTGYAMCMHEANVKPNDDWLISGPILPRQDDPDSVGFFYRVYQAGRVLKLQIWVMHGQNVADTMLALACLSVSDTAYRRCAASLSRFDGDTIYVGFRLVGVGDSSGVCLDDIWFAGARLPGPGISVMNAHLATYPLVAGESDTALLKVGNGGPSASSELWTYASLGMMSESTLVGPLDVGETDSVRIALPLTPLHDTMIDYRLWADDPNGKDINDSTQLLCWSFPTSTYAAEGFDDPVFPPPGWLVADSAGPTHSWAREYDLGRSHSGTSFASCVRESVGKSDDWLITAPIYPNRDCIDSVGFFVRGRMRFWPDTLDVLTLSARQPSIRLLTLGALDTTYSRHSLSLDTCDGDTVRIAFRYHTPFAVAGMSLDDIWFSRIDTSHVEPPPRDMVRRSDTKLPSLAIAPNPALGRLVIVKCYTADGAVSRLSLRDVLGRIVTTFSVPSGTTRLDLRGFTAGVYMITLDGSVPLVSRRLIISR